MIPAALVQAPLLILDLDGTLYDGDSMRDFLAYLVRHRALRSAAGGRLAVALGRSLLRRREPGHRREMLLTALLAGCSPAAVSSLAAGFAGGSRRRLRASLVTCVRQRAQRDAVTILATGAPDLYVPALLQDVPLRKVLATPTDVDGRRVRFPRGPLVGRAKLAAVQQAARDLGFGADQTAALSDHHLDLELLEWARWPFVMTPTPELAAIARRRSWDRLDAGLSGAGAARPAEGRGRA